MINSTNNLNILTHYNRPINNCWSLIKINIFLHHERTSRVYLKEDLIKFIGESGVPDCIRQLIPVSGVEGEGHCQCDGKNKSITSVISRHLLFLRQFSWSMVKNIRAWVGYYWVQPESHIAVWSREQNTKYIIILEVGKQCIMICKEGSFF